MEVKISKYRLGLARQRTAIMTGAKTLEEVKELTYIIDLVGHLGIGDVTGKVLSDIEAFVGGKNIRLFIDTRIYSHNKFDVAKKVEKIREINWQKPIMATVHPACPPKALMPLTQKNRDPRYYEHEHVQPNLWMISPMFMLGEHSQHVDLSPIIGEFTTAIARIEKIKIKLSKEQRTDLDQYYKKVAMVSDLQSDSREKMGSLATKITIVQEAIDFFK